MKYVRFVLLGIFFVFYLCATKEKIKLSKYFCMKPEQIIQKFEKYFGKQINHNNNDILNIDIKIVKAAQLLMSFYFKSVLFSKKESIKYLLVFYNNSN